MTKQIKLLNIENALTILSLGVILLLPPYGVIIAFIGISLYLSIGKKRLQKWQSIGFQNPNKWVKLILITFGLAVIIELSFSIIITPIIEQVTHNKPDISQYDFIRDNLASLLLMILVGWIVGGFIEEIVFRGFLLNRISAFFSNKNTGDIIGIIITSAAFGFSHLYQGWSGVISTGLVAVVLGILFIKSKKVLWYTIFTHGFIDLIGLTLIYFDIEEQLSNLIFQ